MQFNQHLDPLRLGLWALFFAIYTAWVIHGCIREKKNRARRWAFAVCAPIGGFETALMTWGLILVGKIGWDDIAAAGFFGAVVLFWLLILYISERS